MNKLKAILIDLSGTLHVGDELIAGSVEALKKLATKYL
jgi:ribonucleotide monophosphatase NagD (HAD superfamily)